MKVRDEVKVRGRCRLTIRDVKTGKLLEQTPWRDNLVTNKGEELYAQLMRGDALDPCGYCEVGSGNTPAQETDTALETPLDRLEVTDATISAHPFTVTYSTFFSSADGVKISGDST